MRTCPLGSMLWGRRSASSPSDAQLCTHGFDDSLSGCCEGGCLFAYYGFRGSGRESIDPIRFVIGGACWSPFPFPGISGCQLVPLASAPCSSLSPRVACGFSLPRPCPFLPRHGAPFHGIPTGLRYIVSSRGVLLVRLQNRGSSLGETTCRSALLNGEQVLMGDERQLARLLAP